MSDPAAPEPASAHPAHADDGWNPKSHRPPAVAMVLFCLYTLAYAVFIYLAVFKTDSMSKPAIAGTLEVNGALVYGMGLILGAILFAFLYMLLFRPPAATAKTTESQAH